MVKEKVREDYTMKVVYGKIKDKGIVPFKIVIDKTLRFYLLAQGLMGVQVWFGSMIIDTYNYATALGVISIAIGMLTVHHTIEIERCNNEKLRYMVPIRGNFK